MKRHYVLGAVALMASAGIAFAQAPSTKPGGNVATSQGPCAQGYAKAAPGGRIDLTAEQKKNIDTNNDGNISKSEFDTACTKGLFGESKN